MLINVDRGRVSDMDPKKYTYVIEHLDAELYEWSRSGIHAIRTGVIFKNTLHHQTLLTPRSCW